MWYRVLVRSAPVLRSPRVLFQSSSCQAPRQTSLALSRRANSASSLPIYRHSRFFATQSENDNDACTSPVTTSCSTDSSARHAGVPGIESSGEKFVMVYTCSVCETRSAKTISKHGYYKGVVLVRCPGCENLHLVADRLGWFEDGGTDVESLLKQKGEKVRFITGEDVLELTESDILGDRSKE